MTRTVAALALLATLVAAPAQAGPRPLPVYMMRIGPQIDAYGAIAATLGKLLDQPPRVNIDPLVEKLNAIADRLDRVNARWLVIQAPTGLRLRHRGMGRAFVLFADAVRIHAAALFTRHPDEISAAIPKVVARLRSAAYLQQRWAAALRGALIRAGMKVPKWLHGMATQRP
jgi:hypothetical protein